MCQCLALVRAILKPCVALKRLSALLAIDHARLRPLRRYLARTAAVALPRYSGNERVVAVGVGARPTLFFPFLLLLFDLSSKATFAPFCKAGIAYGTYNGLCSVTHKHIAPADRACKNFHSVSWIFTMRRNVALGGENSFRGLCPMPKVRPAKRHSCAF